MVDKHTQFRSKSQSRRPIFLSKETNEIQRVVTLRQVRNKRFHFKEFIIEGVTSIDHAFSHGWTIKALFYNRDIQLSDWAKNYINDEKIQKVYAVTSKLMQVISDREELPEILVIGEAKFKDFTNYAPAKKNEVIAVLDRPKSAGNLGMIIRSAAAFGVSGIVLSGHSADEYDPICIRASVGAFFFTPIYHVEGIDRYLEKLQQLTDDQMTVLTVATGDQGNDELDQMNFSANVLFLILGNETLGVSRGYREAASKFLRIPLASDHFTSLNIAAAASIFFYAIHTQRLQKGAGHQISSQS